MINSIIFILSLCCCTSQNNKCPCSGCGTFCHLLSHIKQTMAAVLVADLTTNYLEVNSKHTYGFYQ